MKEFLKMCENVLVVLIFPKEDSPVFVFPVCDLDKQGEAASQC